MSFPRIVGWLWIIAVSNIPTEGRAQRTYSPHSVLANGAWFKFGITQSGIYKIDLPFLNKLGISTGNLSSASVRLYGNGGGMLSETAGANRADDLVENAMWVEDGGDGVLNGNDYLLFYGEGPHQWEKDSLRQRFVHRQNLYTDTTYYFLTIGGVGKRVLATVTSDQPNAEVNTYQYHLYHELDSVNLLSSGKLWLGEELSNLPGKSLAHSYSLSLPPGALSAAWLRINAVARSINTTGKITAQLGASTAFEINFSGVGSGPYDLFAQSVFQEGQVALSENTNTLSLQYASGSYGSQAWVDWWEVQGRAPLSMAGVKQLSFRDWQSVSAGRKVAYAITAASGVAQVWEVTNPAEPVQMNLARNASEVKFVYDASRLREYIAFSLEGVSVPVPMGKILNQDLHALAAADLLIVTTDPLFSEASRVASFHQQQGLRTNVIAVSQIYREFASGTPDPTAIRDFVKMFYDRAGTDSTLRPRYLLLFGDASFDYRDRIRGNTNGVPAFESESSLDPLTTYTSDDFFGLLDNGESINSSAIPLLDIAIGRIPAATFTEARNYVDKVFRYTSAASLGSWRNELTFIADDEDDNLHLRDADEIAQSLTRQTPLYTLQKIYLDAYPQESGAAGSRYPEANLQSINKLNNGTLIWNYSGHGGFRRLAEEVILDQSVLEELANTDRLPLLITATCDVAPYDNPLVASIGENSLLRAKTGAIALLTTTRLVFAFSNKVINKNYLEAALKKKADGSYPSLGEALRQAKNYTYAFFGDPVNNRKFTLLGDPALTLNFPKYQVNTTHINGQPVGAVPDTLKALSAYTVAGEVVDMSGNRLRDFQGTIQASVFEKERQRTTLGNDAGSPVTTFTEQRSLVFRGKAQVSDGKFQFSFVVPKDIDYRYGKGKLSYYGDNGSLDANGFSTGIIIGGSGTGVNDQEGPSLKAWLNDERFTDGGLTNASPVLLLSLKDSSGINILGNGIGHDLSAILDGDPSRTFLLNAYYEADRDNYRSGRVRFQLPKLADGLHTLSIKAWDVANNATEKILTFRVADLNVLKLEHVLNYPNPFTTHTQFWFDHNRPGEPLTVSVQLYTLTGKLVRTLRNTIISEGNRSMDMTWDGRDEFGNRLARGVYLYHLKVTSNDGKTAQQWEKIYLL